MIESLKKTLKILISYSATFLKWAIFAIIVGVVGGAVGAVFANTIALVTDVREANSWLIYLLPIGGVIIAAVYHFLKVRGFGTNQVFESVREEGNVPFLLAPAIYLGSAITHLLGGSAGKEGAALQLGGSIASGMGKIMGLDAKNRHIMIMCGMSAVFSAVFGTPLCATVFAVEVVSVGYIYTFAMFPCLVSSLSAYSMSKLMGVHGEHFNVAIVPETDWLMALKVIAVAVIAAVVSIIFCKAMHGTHHLFAKIKNEYIRAAVGGAIIIALTLLVGNTDYNGGGLHIIEAVFNEGNVEYEAFLLKIVFTAITIGAGFKGGEIVPTLFIGATLGGAVGSLIGLPIAFAAALGIAAMFCGVTNCPLATILLCLELFGAKGLIFYVLAALLSFSLSGYYSLYTGQKIVFSKISDEIIDTSGH